LTDRYTFESEHDFLEKLKSLVKGGVKYRDLEIHAPHPIHDLDEIIGTPPSKVRLFALIGGLAGAATGYLFTTYTAIDWKLITGGKPFAAIPPYTIIAFELMVLFGALSSFLGFILTSRLPAVRTIISDDEFQDYFEILVRKGEGR
jgi:hypothetical protein